MARYIGPKSKIARRFGEPIFGADKVLSRRNFPPGQHGNNRRRKMSEYAVMLAEKAFIDSELERVKISDNDPDSYDEETIKKWLKTFVRRFFNQQKYNEKQNHSHILCKGKYIT